MDWRIILLFMAVINAIGALFLLISEFEFPPLWFIEVYQNLRRNLTVFGALIPTIFITLILLPATILIELLMLIVFLICQLADFWKKIFRRKDIDGKYN